MGAGYSAPPYGQGTSTPEDTPYIPLARWEEGYSGSFTIAKIQPVSLAKGLDLMLSPNALSNLDPVQIARLNQIYNDMIKHPTS